MSIAEPNVQSILLGDAIEHAPAAVLVADDDGRYVAANAFACRMLGYERAELLELRVSDVATDAQAEDDFEAMIARRSVAGTTRLRRKDGSDLLFEYRGGETQVAGMTYYVAVGWPAR